MPTSMVSIPGMCPRSDSSARLTAFAWAAFCAESLIFQTATCLITEEEADVSDDYRMLELLFDSAARWISSTDVDADRSRLACARARSAPCGFLSARIRAL